MTDQTPSKPRICRTANLTLASYLAMTGKPYRLVRGQGQSAAWEFIDDPIAEQNKKEFEEGQARVEPQAFHHTVTRTRRLLYDFIESNDASWDEAKVKASKHWVEA